LTARAWVLFGAQALAAERKKSMTHVRNSIGLESDVKKKSRKK
jgi:hypothetical protein